MKKILLGLIAVAVLAAGSYFGFDFYAQRRVTRDVEAAFEQVRATGAKASHGKITFDVKSRTLTIADVATESGTQSPVSVKIANLTMTGLGQTDAARVSAGNVEFSDVEIGVAGPTPTITSLTYKAPRITVKDYSGPTSLPQLPAASSILELYRSAFGLLASINASSVAAPSLTGTMTFSAAAKAGDGAGGEFAYSGIAIENIKDGKIASSKTDKVVFTINQQTAGKPIKMTGELANIAATDIDVGAMAAIFDPGKASDDREYRVQGHVSAGPYVITAAPGVNMRIEGVTVDDTRINPSRMQLPALLAMIPPQGSPPPSAAQARDLLDKIAGLYSGIGIANAEMHGLSVETPQGPLKLASMRFNFEHGKIGELAVEGLDTRAPNGPIKVGRFALKSLDVANFMRLSAQFAAQKPSAEQALALFPLIEGVEIKGVASPYKATGKPVNIDVVSLDWGQFVGSIPSKLRLTAKLAAPLDAADPRQQPLVAAGIDRMAVDADLGAIWTEASRAFALEPVKLDMAGLLNASARLSLGNVPREAFSTSAAEAMGAAAQIETGTIELTVHDLGVIDLAIAQFARTRNISRDEARKVILDAIKAQGGEIGGGNPDATALLTAISQFVETPGQTLVIKLTPRAKAPALQLMQLLKTDPQSALAQFRIEASTGL
ncbi:hypothetical protein ABIF38_006988 [Bradyrhizobium japonicum]|jgi:hypothetical protein|uniref:hypothetical protein n=1 Tax=Bradyrhizobium TaxID=374 RepID=UPI00035D5008|nr:MULTISPECIES: hypothetical protein [Bradyrhizobium]MCP1730700.1 hypothetical protein [Bradyrhizobium elkanii]MCP1931257.1 hypothetical protein [Bradyrhizobium elkanii]MCS3480618.1 hypothetical protein [Bradyrhizobium elkanii]MCS3517425.1 hypothetical protein [Bradyrhizobium elkanii]MCS3574829.1 hypothetical protein [Bradyrhizobium elkanii]